MIQHGPFIEAHEVKYIFGLCGDTTLPFYDALYRLDHSIKHVLTRDERWLSWGSIPYTGVFTGGTYSVANVATSSATIS